MSFRNSKQFFFIGSYTEMLTEDFGGSGEGIYSVMMDLITGKIETIKTYKVENSAYLISNSSMLYAISELETQNHPRVSAFKVKAKGKLQFLNRKAVDGSLPCHINLHNKSLLIACYGSGNLLSFPLNDNGEILKNNYNFKHSGSSINKNRQEAPHAHQAVIHPNNKSVFVPDLGIDTIKAYNFEKDILTPKPEHDITIPEGNGPRHIVFNKKGDLAYVMNELTGNVAVLKLKGEKFHFKKLYNSLPETFKETPSGSAIRIHPNGKFLYVGNRTIDAITIFEISDDELLVLDCQKTNGKTLREFNITPDGNWLIACLQDSNEVVSYAINSNGKLEEKSRNKTITSPVCVCFN